MTLQIIAMEKFPCKSFCPKATLSSGDVLTQVKCAIVVFCTGRKKELVEKINLIFIVGLVSVI